MECGRNGKRLERSQGLKYKIITLNNTHTFTQFPDLSINHTLADRANFLNDWKGPNCCCSLTFSTNIMHLCGLGPELNEPDLPVFSHLALFSSSAVMIHPSKSMDSFMLITTGNSELRLWMNSLSLSLSLSLWTVLQHVLHRPSRWDWRARCERRARRVWSAWREGTTVQWRHYWGRVDFCQLWYPHNESMLVVRRFRCCPLPFVQVLQVLQVLLVLLGLLGPWALMDLLDLKGHPGPGITEPTFRPLRPWVRGLFWPMNKW